MQPKLIIVSLLLSCSSLKKNTRPVTDLTVDANAEAVARGKYLSDTIAFCSACHDSYEGGDFLNYTRTGSLNGGTRLVEVGANLVLYIPGTTNDPEHGVGNWTDDELLRALRDGVRPDGTAMFPMMPYNSFQYMSDEDAASIVAYLRTVEGAPPAQPRFENELPFPFPMLLKKGITLHPPARDVSAPDRADKVAYGEYLARLGHCADCHSHGKKGPKALDDPEYMAGADTSMHLESGKVYAPNLTSHETGLGGKSAVELTAMLREGRMKSGRRWLPPMGLFQQGLAGMTDEDIEALVAYLQSLPPVEKTVPEPEINEMAEAFLAKMEADILARAKASSTAENAVEDGAEDGANGEEAHPEAAAE